MNVIVHIDKNKSKLAQFLHGTLFGPMISTLQKAITNNYFLRWPGIEKFDFKKLVPNIIPKVLGHLNQEQKNTISKKRNYRDKHYKRGRLLFSCTSKREM